MMQIIKHESEIKRYLLDNKISLKAKGLMEILMSFPDGTEVNMDQVAECCAENTQTVQRHLKELKDSGYIRAYYLKNEKGHFTWVFNLYCGKLGK